jgi:hypothetical protein
MLVLELRARHTSSSMYCHRRAHAAQVRQLEQGNGRHYTLTDTEGDAGSLGIFDAVVLADAMTGRSGKGSKRCRASRYALFLAYCSCCLTPNMKWRSVQMRANALHSADLISRCRLLTVTAMLLQGRLDTSRRRPTA